MPSATGLKQELVSWKFFWNGGRHEDKPEGLMDALPYTDEDIVLNIRQLILIGCTTLIGTCQAERSFLVTLQDTLNLLDAKYYPMLLIPNVCS